MSYFAGNPMELKQKRYCKRHRKYHKHHHYGCSRPSPSSDSSSDSSSENSDFDGTSNIEVFRSYAKEIKKNRDLLLVKFPKYPGLPSRDDMEWCSLCLGYQLCKEIYGDKTPGEMAVNPRKLPKRKYPLLSIVLHLSQVKVKLLLKFLLHWLRLKGLKYFICLWIYALLTCLDKSDIGDDCDRTLEEIYKEFEKRLDSCGEWQIPRATVIMEILDDYFKVNEPVGDSD